MPQEVITLQFGKIANFTGAHYWNIQDELLGLQERDEQSTIANQINNNVLYRERYSTHSDPTYTPRLLIFDTKDSTGPHPASQLHTPSSLPAWDGQPVIHQRPHIPTSEFAQEVELDYKTSSSYQEQKQQYVESYDEHIPLTSLERAARALDKHHGAVERFSDFLKAPLHPQSMQFMEGIWNASPELNAWHPPESWSATSDQREESMERIRILAEESDSLAGFQCLVDDTSCWGSIARDVLQEVRDDYGNGRSVLLFALRPSAPTLSSPESMRHAHLCRGLSTASLTQHCDLYMPICGPIEASAVPYIHWRARDIFHESALYAGMIHCATLPYRLKKGSVSAMSGQNEVIGALDMTSLVDMVISRYSHAPLAALHMSFPCPNIESDIQQSSLQHDSRIEQYHHNTGNAPMSMIVDGNFSTTAANFTADSVIPGSRVSVGGHNDPLKFSECVVLSGPRSKYRQPMDLSLALESLDASLANEPYNDRVMRHRVLTSQPLPVPLPFPGFFSNEVSEWGDISTRREAGVEESGHHVKSVPMLVKMAGSRQFQNVVQWVGKEFSTASRSSRGLAILESWGVDKDGREEVCERLEELASAYEEED